MLRFAEEGKNQIRPVANWEWQPCTAKKSEKTQVKDENGKLLKATVHPKNKLNDLTATEWITRTVSVFVQRGLGSGSLDAKFEKLHPAPYSFTDVTRFVEFFTKAGGNVLDPFGGVGSSAKASALIGRYCTCVEISELFANAAKERMVAELPEAKRKFANIIHGDIQEKSNELQDSYFDLLLTSPPYWTILDKVDHKAKQERIQQGQLHNYGSNEGDISTIKEYDEFLVVLTSIFDRLAAKISKSGHAVIIVGDFRHKSRYYLFHSDLAQALEKLGRWRLKGISIMYQKHKRVFPYGYPYSYVPNLHHQYALIFQKVEKQ